MQKKINLTSLFIISTILLAFTNVVTYVLLLSKNEECKLVLTEKSMYSSDAFVAADAVRPKAITAIIANAKIFFIMITSFL